jgi:hypothetical protein
LRKKKKKLHLFGEFSVSTLYKVIEFLKVTFVVLFK